LARRVASIRLGGILCAKKLAGWDVIMTCVTTKQEAVLFCGMREVFIVKIGYLLLAADVQDVALGKVGLDTTHDAR